MYANNRNAVQNEDSFWRDLKDEQHRLDEWISKKTDASSMRRKQKVRLCSSLYLKTKDKAECSIAVAGQGK